jgi:DNA polymerase
VDSGAISIFSDIVSCPLRCAGIRNEPERGVIPRSFYCSGSTSVDLLIVGKNPGHSPEWEQSAYRGLTASVCVKTHLDIVKKLFTGELSVPTRFHANLLRRVGGVLGVAPTLEAVFSRAALTALVKCESIGAKTDNLPLTTAETCADRYLRREIALYKPAYILALGHEAYRYLSQPRVRQIIRLPVGELYHPSWSNMPGGETHYFQTVIPRLHEEFKAALQRRT